MARSFLTMDIYQTIQRILSEIPIRRHLHEERGFLNICDAAADKV